VLQERGAGPERVVGLAMPRGPELVVAVLATLRAGAAFLPLDPGQPAARLKAMAGEAKPVTVLTAADVTGARPRHEFTPVAVDPRCPACLTYTSGSTGVPKGVLLTRAGLHNRPEWPRSTASPTRTWSCTRPRPGWTWPSGSWCCPSSPAPAWSWPAPAGTATRATSSN
jgi:non-ribosomal peptide synthetase component F